MPARALRPCKQIGCTQLTREAGGYCAEHQNVVNEYERYRGSARTRGYDRVWERLREVVLRKNPLCKDCIRVGRLTSATEVHHIKKVREHPELRLVISNLLCLCKSCHSTRTGRGE